MPGRLHLEAQRPVLADVDPFDDRRIEADRAGEPCAASPRAGQADSLKMPARIAPRRSASRKKALTMSASVKSARRRWRG